MKSMMSYPLIYTLWLIIIIIALLAPLISSDVPILAKDSEGIHIPILNREVYLRRNIEAQWSIPAPLPYHPETLNGSQHFYAAPGNHGHALGADGLGRDVLAGILYGLRSALLVAFISLLIACALGLNIGMAVGYYGNNRLHVSRFKLALFIIIVLLGAFVIARLASIDRLSGISILLFILVITMVVYLLSRDSIHRKSKTRTSGLDRDGITGMV